jgi:hypothetical protein
LLPVRQSIGQFLAGFAPATLSGGLQGVTVTAGPDLAAEGRVLGAWIGRRLVVCGAAEAVTKPVLQTGAAGHLAVSFRYAQARHFFRWSGDLANGHATFEADFGAGRTTLPASISLLAPENALSEAMFF